VRSSEAAVAAGPQQKRKESTLSKIKKNYVLYLFLLPAIVYLTIFNYVPMYGIQIAFKNYNSFDGINGSPWVGMLQFSRFFSSYNCVNLICNTLFLSLYLLVATFPLPILLALVLNYATLDKLKKVTQTVTYAPHFISTVVMVGMILVFFSSNGVVNQFIKFAGLPTTDILGTPGTFRNLYVWTDVWQHTGWNCIIYIAALAGVNPELHEAAIVDGANKMQRIWNIDIPTLMPTAIILLILQTGNLMNVGFEKAYLMQNGVNISSSEIISTYVYKIGILGAQFSYSTAIGLFNNVINFILLLTVNKVASRTSETSLW
jgi:putative aldouronate transport system permease protein